MLQRFAFSSRFLFLGWAHGNSLFFTCYIVWKRKDRARCRSKPLQTLALAQAKTRVQQFLAPLSTAFHIQKKAGAFLKDIKKKEKGRVWFPDTLK
jgi:hypothetical protein